jgi:hypothetical protein
MRRKSLGEKQQVQAEVHVGRWMQAKLSPGLKTKEAPSRRDSFLSNHLPCEHLAIGRDVNPEEVASERLLEVLRSPG